MWCRVFKLSSQQPSKYQTFSRIIEKRFVSLLKKTLEKETHEYRTIEKFEKNRQAIVKVIEKNGRRKFIKVKPAPHEMATQSVILPGTNGIRASAFIDDPLRFLERPEHNIKTVYDVFLRGCSYTKSGECLGTRSLLTGKYEWLSYSEVTQRKDFIGSAFINLGLSPEQSSMVGICTKNRAEFVLTMLGCCSQSLVFVPLYESYGNDVLTFIIKEVEMPLVICENKKSVQDILKNSEKYPCLKYIIVIDAVNEDAKELTTSSIKVMTFKNLEEIGKQHIRKRKLPTPEDLFCICYTSGTTGVPKGVMITHSNVISCLASLEFVIGKAVPQTTTLISYLPCAHIYELINEVYSLYHGGRLGFYSGDTQVLFDDIISLKPTVVPLVPKVMNQIYAGVKRRIMPFPLKRIFYYLALNQKEKDLKKGIISNTTIWDKLIFSKIQKILGGSCELIFTTSAPVPKDVMKFFRCASGCLVFEAYGQSEICAATMTLLSEHDSGFVGPPIPCNHIKLISVPELNYDAAMGVGEICIRGRNVFQGYFKNPEATKEAIDEEGWHHTGDIGKWLPNGALSIIDRKKHIFKLSQGEYIAPEKTENVYSQSHILSHIFIEGLPNEDFVVAIAVPNKDPFLKWAKEKGFSNIGSYEDICQDKVVRQEVLKHMLAIGKKKKLNSLHQAGNVYLTVEPFSVENGLLTPTLKLKRSFARNKFKNIINELYQEGNLRKKYSLDK